MDHQFKPGDRVVSPGPPYDLHAVVTALCDNGRELEVAWDDAETGERLGDFWPIEDTRLDIECTTCGKLATHLYAVWHAVEPGYITSINGRGRWSPACPECDEPELIEPEPGVFRITGPIEMWPSLPR